MIDKKVQQILSESKARVTVLLQAKELPLRDLAVGLYKYDYLDATEIEMIFEGKQLEKENVREYDPELNEYY